MGGGGRGGGYVGTGLKKKPCGCFLSEVLALHMFLTESVLG